MEMTHSSLSQISQEATGSRIWHPCASQRKMDAATGDTTQSYSGVRHRMLLHIQRFRTRLASFLSDKGSLGSLRIRCSPSSRLRLIGPRLRIPSSVCVGDFDRLVGGSAAQGPVQRRIQPDSATRTAHVVLVHGAPWFVHRAPAQRAR